MAFASTILVSPSVSNIAAIYNPLQAIQAHTPLGGAGAEDGRGGGRGEVRPPGLHGDRQQRVNCRAVGDDNFFLERPAVVLRNQNIVIHARHEDGRVAGFHDSDQQKTCCCFKGAGFLADDPRWTDDMPVALFFINIGLP